MSDDKYRQLSSTRKNCKQGHWTGTPSGGTNDGGCWLCRFGCAILSYLKWKGLEPNEANVTKYLNQNADADWGKWVLRKKLNFKLLVSENSSQNHILFILRAIMGIIVVFLILVKEVIRPCKKMNL